MKLSDKYDKNPLIKDVSMARCTTEYAEPFVRRVADQRNKATATAAGYTDSQDIACIKQDIAMYQTVWPTTRAILALNPYQTFSGDSTLKTSIPLEMMEYCITQLKDRCILGNTSIRQASQGADYDAMYAEMTAKHQPITLQTAEPTKIGDWRIALQRAIDVGASSIELNRSYTTYDKVFLAKIVDELSKNATTTHQ